jgi:hypothetical protein
VGKENVMNNQTQSWLDEALDLCPDDESIRQEARDYLQPLMKRCRSNSRKAFWQFLRLTLAKSQDTAIFLAWMQESKLRPVEKAKDGFHYHINGDVALISVTSGDDHAVWRIPVSRLEWALSMYPVSLKRLPELESHNAAKIRQLKAKVKRERSSSKRAGLENDITKLEVAEQREYPPVPRYMLIKNADAQEFEVHRIYTNAGDNDQIKPVDDDFMNFATTRVRFIFEATNCPVVPYPTFQTEVAVQNLQIINNADAQQDFEKSFLQVKETPHGDIKTSLAVRANADLGRRTGVNGFIQDCGGFVPLSHGEIIDLGLVGGEVRPLDEAAALQRKWRVPSPQQGNRWGM